MCKEMPVIPVNKVVDPKRKIGKRRAEEERHKGLLTKKKYFEVKKGRPPLSFSLPLGLFFRQNLQTHHPIKATTTRTMAAKMAKIILQPIRVDF
jgi:hypothetical protein